MRKTVANCLETLSYLLATYCMPILTCIWYSALIWNPVRDMLLHWQKVPHIKYIKGKPKEQRAVSLRERRAMLKGCGIVSGSSKGMNERLTDSKKFRSDLLHFSLLSSQFVLPISFWSCDRGDHILADIVKANGVYHCGRERKIMPLTAGRTMKINNCFMKTSFHIPCSRRVATFAHEIRNSALRQVFGTVHRRPPQLWRSGVEFILG